MKKLYLFILALSGLSITAQQNIIVSVNMSNYTSAFTTVYISGTFNAWSADSNPLTDDGSGIWSTTITVPDGVIDYKFQLDKWAAQESLVDGLYCTSTVGGFTNRRLVVAGADQELPTPYYNDCYDDGNAGPHETTFNVDMSGYLGSFSGVYINGAFNSWCGECNPLTNQGGGIWSVTLPLAESSQVFKFTLDGWLVPETFTAGTTGTVTSYGNTNRYISISYQQSNSYVWNTGGSTSNILLGTKDFSVTDQSVKSFPNPSNADWNVAAETSISSIKVYDITGKLVVELTPNTDSVVISTLGLVNGIYVAEVVTADGGKIIKLAKN